MRQKMGPLHWIGFVAILVWCLLPVAWIISLSFKSIAETTVGSPQFLPKNATIDNYKSLLDYNNPAATTSCSRCATRSGSRSSPPRWP